MKTETQILESLGGTTRVSEMFEISAASVSEWKKTGIPEARKQTLWFMFPSKVPQSWATRFMKENSKSK